MTGTVAEVNTRTRGEIVRGYLASFETSDPDAVAACVTADFVNEHLAELGSGSRGRDVAVRYRFEATYDTGPIDIPGMMWFDVRDELVARRTDLWDSLTFLRQTGRPSEAEEEHESAGFGAVVRPDEHHHHATGFVVGFRHAGTVPFWITVWCGDEASDFQVRATRGIPTKISERYD